MNSAGPAIAGDCVSRVGVVAIGRNEGERLRRCLASLDAAARRVVYVDSGSIDGSAEMARSIGVEVIDLDLAVPFTAARARNEGFERLLQIAPEIEFVQFVDGDCEIVAGWWEKAESALRNDEKVAVVCGRRRERHPEKSIYNRLCDVEWDTPIGEAHACGGDALMRVTAMKQAGGYDPDVIAAEDDEVCLRIRRAGWKIVRIDAEMSIHDAAMTRFRQWWKRAVRCGYAYALGAFMHGRGPERHFRRERRRLILWGFLIPAVLLAAACPSDGWSLLGFLLYPIQVARIFWRTRRRATPGVALAFGVSCMASKLPEFFGLCRFYLTRLRGQRIKLIEYK
jgi:GT2 family glycosyltransferase